MIFSGDVDLTGRWNGMPTRNLHAALTQDGIKREPFCCLHGFRRDRSRGAGEVGNARDEARAMCGGEDLHRAITRDPMRALLAARRLRNLTPATRVVGPAPPSAPGYAYRCGWSEGRPDGRRRIRRFARFPSGKRLPGRLLFRESV